VSGVSESRNKIRTAMPGEVLIKQTDRRAEPDRRVIKVK